MNKNIIRLTETELKQVISESVKQVISELDWKTYNNAARKRYQQKDYSKGNNLSFYADDKFDRQHGYYNPNTPEIVGRDSLTGVSLRYKRNPDFDNQPHDSTLRTVIDDDGKHKLLRKKSLDQCDIRQLDRAPSPLLQHAHNEYSNYINGNYEYTKGKGWHLKDKM